MENETIHINQKLTYPRIGKSLENTIEVVEEEEIVWSNNKYLREKKYNAKLSCVTSGPDSAIQYQLYDDNRAMMALEAKRTNKHMHRLQSVSVGITIDRSKRRSTRINIGKL